MDAPLLMPCPHCDRVNRVPAARLGEGPNCGACKQALVTGLPLALDSARFARHLAGDLPLLIDFWAPWCGPCRQMAPAFEQAAARLAPGVRCAKVNTDEVGDVAARYGIRSIPTIILFSGGREVARQAGAMPAGALEAWARQHLPR